MLMDRELILQMVKTKTTVKQASTLWKYTHLQRAWFPAPTSREQDLETCVHYSWTTEKEAD